MDTGDSCSLQQICRLLMIFHEPGQVDIIEPAVLHQPAACNHHPIGLMSAAKNERGKRVTMAGKARLIKLEERKIRLLANLDLADIVAAKATGRAFGRHPDHPAMVGG